MFVLRARYASRRLILKELDDLPIRPPAERKARGDAFILAFDDVILRREHHPAAGGDDAFHGIVNVIRPQCAVTPDALRLIGLAVAEDFKVAAVARVQQEYNAEGEFIWTDRSLDVHHRSQWWGTTKDGVTSVQITEVELRD